MVDIRKVSDAEAWLMAKDAARALHAAREAEEVAREHYRAARDISRACQRKLEQIVNPELSIYDDPDV